MAYIAYFVFFCCRLYIYIYIYISDAIKSEQEKSVSADSTTVLSLADEYKANPDLLEAIGQQVTPMFLSVARERSSRTLRCMSLDGNLSC